MLLITSPAKSLDLDSDYNVEQITQPVFLKEASIINKILKLLSESELSQLMSISANLAELNYRRNQLWHQDHTPKDSRPAFHIYKGDIYREMTPETYTKAQQAYAQKTVRMISGLYGILRPYDLMQPYRLEMKTKLPVKDHPNLVKFWQPILTNFINQEIVEQNHQLFLNLASDEYSKAIDLKALNCKVIKVNFQEYRDGKLKTVAIFSKKARGMMIEFCIKHQVETVNQLQSFNAAGYKYTKQTEDTILFTRT